MRFIRTALAAIASLFNPRRAPSTLDAHGEDMTDLT
jgi:hypothetical protein